ncbi:MAG: hypothetical protein K6F19_08280 [Oscillospiraceae bacterium]|nr:hypothetical protein [Oscillospiraceae bacterium]
MTYEKMTGEINLEELEVQAEEVTEASAGLTSRNWRAWCTVDGKLL